MKKAFSAEAWESSFFGIGYMYRYRMIGIMLQYAMKKSYCNTFRDLQYNRLKAKPQL